MLPSRTEPEGKKDLQILQYFVRAGWLPLCWRFYRFYPLTQWVAGVFSSLSSQLPLLLCCLGPPLTGRILIGVDIAKLLEQLAFLRNLFICSRPVHRLFQCNRLKHIIVLIDQATNLHIFLLFLSQFNTEPTLYEVYLYNLLLRGKTTVVKHHYVD